MAIKPDDLYSFLKHLRMHGFALVHYGGNVLAQAVDAPTAGRTWSDDLERFAASITEGEEEARCLVQSIKASLFDLNKTGNAGVQVAKAISEAECKV